jgi:hypothetical protein
MLFFFFSLLQNQNRRAEQVMPRGKGWHQRRGEVLGKEGRRVNTV